MQQNLKKIAFSTGSFVAKHRVAIAVTVTAITTAVVMDKLRGAALHNYGDFLMENDLVESFRTWADANNR